jgi:hypothetical protein
MTNIKIIYNEKEYIIFYKQIKYKVDEETKDRIPIKFHIPLFIALMKRLTKQQKLKLIIIHNDLYIINFSTLLDIFIYNNQTELNKYYIIKNKNKVYTDELDIYSEDNYCICTHKIKLTNMITNKETKKCYIIGCDCIEWWQIYNDKVKIDHEIKKALINKTDIPLFCSFCCSKRNCIKCKDKENIRYIFNNWRSKINDKISYIKKNINSLVEFGKYKGKTFNILCKDVSYRNFIVSNGFNNIKKEEIMTKINIYRKYEKQIIKYII